MRRRGEHQDDRFPGGDPADPVDDGDIVEREARGGLPGYTGDLAVGEAGIGLQLQEGRGAGSAAAARALSPRTRQRFTAAWTPGPSRAAARAASSAAISALSVPRVAGTGS